MIDNPPEVKLILDLLEQTKKQFFVELELCKTIEDCYALKLKYLGKNSVVNQILRKLGENAETR